MEVIAKSLLLKIVLKFLGFVTPIVLLFLISPELYGEFVINNTLALITSTLLGFSIGNTHIFYNNKSSFIILLNSTLIILIILFLIAAFTGITWIYLSSVYSIQKFNNAFLRDKKHLFKFFGLQILEKFLFLIIVYFSLSTINLNIGVLDCMIIASIITTCPVFLYIFLVKYSYYSKQKEFTPLKELLSYSMRGHIGVAAQKINNKIDILFLSIFMTSATVGYYNILVSLSILIWTLPDAINSYLLKELVSSNFQTKIKLVKFYSKIILISVIVCFIIFLIWNNWFLSFYSGLPLEYGPLLLILMIGTGFFAIAKIKIRFFTSINKPEVGSIVALIGLANTLTLMPLLAWNLDLIGAVIASSIGYVISSLYVLLIPRIN